MYDQIPTVQKLLDRLGSVPVARVPEVTGLVDNGDRHRVWTRRSIRAGLAVVGHVHLERRSTIKRDRVRRVGYVLYVGSALERCFDPANRRSTVGAYVLRRVGAVRSVVTVENDEGLRDGSI